MKKLDDLIVDLCSVMSVTGSEGRRGERFDALLSPLFDEYSRDPLGSILCVRRCGKKDAPRVLIDAHIDEVGMIVTGICDGGFLRVTNAGGIDTRILPAAEVVIYGKRELFGVVVSTPPHLQSEGDEKKLPKITDIMIDTGYTKEELTSLVPLGTPVGYFPKYRKLANDRICGKGFDDKACAAAAINAVAGAPRDKLCADIYLLLSVREETSGAGARAGAYSAKPDCALAVDVDLADFPDDTPDYKTVALGGGLSLAYSPVTDRRLNEILLRLGEENDIPIQKIVSPSSTGTNADGIGISRAGIPVALVGIPLSYMHTASEVLDMRDARATSDIIAAFITSENAVLEAIR